MSENKAKLAGLPFVIGGLSFIPLVGVPFGMAAIVWGLVTKKSGGKKLAFVGALGIGCTIVLYSAVFYFGFVQRGGIYDGLRSQLSQTNLYSVVLAIEFHRLQYGTYPESLEALQKTMPRETLIFFFDPADVVLGTPLRTYFYERVGVDHYYLRGVGVDKEPFTADDIVPMVEKGPGSKVGLLVERQ
jgi:hypothetical protein